MYVCLLARNNNKINEEKQNRKTQMETYRDHMRKKGKKSQQSRFLQAYGGEDFTLT
jgi:hypothetical protein